MKGTSKVIMGATLVMVVILAIVLGVILVLLAELYCSMLLRRRRQQRLTTSTTATAGNTPANDSSSHSLPLQDQFLSHQPLRSLYAHGVLNAPRNILFPAVVNGAEDKVVDIEKQQTQQKPTTTTPASPPPSPPFVISLIPPNPVDKITHISDSTSGCNGGGEHLVYISNPIYDDDDGGRGSRDNTPFETPDTSPSRLEDGGSSGEEIEEDSSPASCSPNSSVRVTTPPLTPMKKLPAEGSSVSLRDARSLGTSGSDSNSNNDGLSSSSSGSPRTSPSW